MKETAIYSHIILSNQSSRIRKLQTRISVEGITIRHVLLQGEEKEIRNGGTIRDVDVRKFAENREPSREYRQKFARKSKQPEIHGTFARDL